VKNFSECLLLNLGTVTLSLFVIIFAKTQYNLHYKIANDHIITVITGKFFRFKMNYLFKNIILNLILHINSSNILKLIITLVINKKLYNGFRLYRG
jgi:hypothetical protein